MSRYTIKDMQDDLRQILDYTSFDEQRDYEDSDNRAPGEKPWESTTHVYGNICRLYLWLGVPEEELDDGRPGDDDSRWRGDGGPADTERGKHEIGED